LADSRLLLLIIEGAADRSQQSLGGRTPLEAASTPILDSLASKGCGGLMYPVSPGICATGDLALWHMLGYGGFPYPGRAVLEALGAGIELALGEVAAHVELASTSREEGELFVQVPSVGMSEEQSKSIYRSLSDYSGKHFRTRLHRIGGSSMILVLAGGASPAVTGSDPFFYRLAVETIEPLEGGPQEARMTADELNRFTQWAREILDEHPVTRERDLEYMTRANDVLVKWTGLFGEIPSFEDLWGFHGVAAASSLACLGAASATGMESAPVFEADASADLRTKLEVALGALATEFDFAVVHTGAAGEVYRTGKPSRKVAAIEQLDSAVEVAARMLSRDSETVLAVTAGKTTPSGGSVEAFCSGEPVPLLISGGGARVDEVDSFDEIAFAAGCLGTVRGGDLMPLLLSAAGRAGPETSRMDPANHRFGPLPG
jgi:2,3-bisphosphoglycerate-independent phosphoglycerate mutase